MKRYQFEFVVVASFAFMLLALVAAGAEPQTRFYDSSGRSIGTATNDSQGTTVFRDAGGRTTGTAAPSYGGGSSGNTTTFRDSGGNVTGRAVGPSSTSPFSGARR
jgi:hypothetical protein